MCRYKVFECTQNAYNGATRTNNFGDVFCRSTSTNYHDATNGNGRAGPRYGKRAACARRSFEPLKVNDRRRRRQTTLAMGRTRRRTARTDDADEAGCEAARARPRRTRRTRWRGRRPARLVTGRPAVGEVSDRAHNNQPRRGGAGREEGDDRRGRDDRRPGRPG